MIGPVRMDQTMVLGHRGFIQMAKKGCETALNNVLPLAKPSVSTSGVLQALGDLLLEQEEDDLQCWTTRKLAVGSC